MKHYEDRLVYLNANGKRQGKRISKLRVLNREEQRAYVKIGAIEAVKMIRQRIGKHEGDLAKALSMLNTERFYNAEHAKEHTDRYDASLMR